MERFTRVGQIAGAWGLKGLVKIQPTTDFPAERFVRGATFRMEGQTVEIESVSTHKGRPLVKFKGVDTIDAAEALQFKYLEAAAKPRTGRNEFLVTDLLGLRVETADGETLGKVDEVLANPAHEILVVGEIMIPLVERFVKNVDLSEGRVIVELIYGMRPGEL